MKKIIIVGGGAAGMMAAITAAGCGVRPILLEGGERVGRKILSTGNGKCNYTNYHMTPDCFRSTDSHRPFVDRQVRVCDLLRWRGLSV